MSTLPIFVLANLASGVASLIPDADLRHPASIDPAPLVAQVHAHRPTRIVASPALLERLADHCAESNLTLPGLKDVYTGGGPVFPRLLDKLQSMAPRAEVAAVYGSTEAEPIAVVRRSQINPEDAAAMREGRGLLAGLPVAAVRLRILPDRWGSPIDPFTRAGFAAACLHPGEAGEIVVSGEHVLPGYLNGRGDGETKFTVDSASWHRTGDAGYLDGRGRLWLLGRSAARIQDAHGVLYPFTVEGIAHQHPGVHRAAVLSHDSRRILAIESEDGATSTDFTSLKAALAWAQIDEILVHARIPVDGRHNAKIDYPALRSLLTQST